MSSVDTRVVEMQFDNKAFGSGVKSSLNDLESLKKGLRLEGATSGLDQVASATKNVKFGDMADEADKAGSRINAMAIFVRTAIATISYQIVRSVEDMAKSMTITPISAGLKSYADQINATQTILANTQAQGTNLQQITDVLAELQDYANKTVYSFSDMTKNISLFTAAGVSLTSSVSAIKGISNLAAMSGVDAEHASGAMFQLSQAISSGVVRLQDWNSVMQAGLGGTTFQNALIQTAKVHGVKVDQMIKKDGSFRESLKEDWLSSQILTETLSQFTGDLTDAQLKQMGYTTQQIADIQKLGKTALDSAVNIRTIPQMMEALHEEVATAWAAVFKVLFGDLNNATSLFSALHNTAENALTGPIYKLKDLLQGWADLGGKAQVVDAFKMAWKALGKVLGAVHDAFREVFPATTAKNLYDASVALDGFMTQLVPSQKTVENIKRTFAGLFAVLDIGWQLIKAGIGFVADLIGHFSKGSGSVLDFTAGIGDFLVKIDAAIKQGNLFGKFFDWLLPKVEKPVDALKHFISVVVQMVKAVATGKAVADVLDRIHKNSQQVADAGTGIANAWDRVKIIFSAIWQAVEPVLAKIGGAVKTVAGAIAHFIAGISFGDVLGAAGIGGIILMLTKVKKAIDKFKSAKLGGGLFASVKESLEQLTGTLKSMQQMLKATTILEIAAAILVLTIAVSVLSKIDAAGLAKATSAIAVMITELTSAMIVMDKMLKNSKAMKMDMLAAGLVLIAVAIDILASAAKKMAGLSWNDLAKGLTGTITLLLGVAAALKLMPEKSKMITTGAGLLLVAAAIKVLASAAKDISDLSWGEIAKGLTGISALLTSLALYTKFSKMSSIGDGAGILLMAAAVKVLASAMKDISGLSWEQIAKGLTGVAGGLIAMSLAMKLLPKRNLLNGAAIVEVAAALKILASAMKDIGNLSWVEIAKGLVGIAGGLVIVSLALKMLPDKNIAQATSILIVTAALKILASALKDMGNMSWTEIAKSLVELAGSMLILVISLNAMDGTISGSAALVVAALALKMLAGAMVVMGGMSWSDIAASLVELAGALLVLVVGLALMEEALPGAAALVVAAEALKILAPVLVMLGAMSWSDILAAIGALALLFAVLAAGGIAAPLISLLGTSLLILAAGVALIGSAIENAGDGINKLADGLTKLSQIDSNGLDNVTAALQTLIDEIPDLISAVAQGMVDFAQKIADGASSFGDAAEALIDQFIRVIRDKMPEAVQAFLDGVVDMLTSVADHMPDMVQKGADIVVSFLEGLANNMGRIAQAGTDVVVAFLNAMGQDIPQVADAGFKMIIEVMNGIADAIRKNAGQMRAAAANIGKAIIDGMTGGVLDNQGGFLSKVKGLASAALSGVKLVLGIHSPSKEFEKVGTFVVEGFAQGLTGNKDKIDSAVSDMVGQLDDAMQSELDDIQQHNDKITSIRDQMNDNAQSIADAQNRVNEAIRDPIHYSTSKSRTTRNQENAKAIQSHNDAVHSAQVALQKLIDKQNDYNNSINAEQAAINQDTAEYWRMNAARSTLINQLNDEQAHLDDLADARDANNQAIQDEQKVLEDAIKTRDDYNQSLRDQYGAQEDISKETKLSDYVTDLQDQIVATQQFTIAIQELRKRGLNDELYKSLLAKGPTEAMPFVQQLLDGGQEALDNINYLGDALDQAAGTLSDDASSALYQAGVDSANGILAGLQSKAADIQAQMDAIAQYMVTALNNALGIHSPSRVMAEIGSYAAQGLAKGLNDSTDLIGKASEGAGRSAIDSMRKTISGLGALVSENMDVNPTIAPVLDLTNIKRDASSIGDLLTAPALSVGSAYSKASDAAAGYAANQAAMFDALTPADQPAPITFVQNNNSPKALSQAEIYRQTNNQLSVAKGALTTNARKS